MQKLKINIFGDICPTSDTLIKFRSGNAKDLFNDLLNYISPSDITIANLECVFTDNPKPVKKAGPVLYASTDCANAFQSIGMDVISIANNHIRDCGDEGVQSTIKACTSRGLKTVGAGRNLDEARKPLIIDKNGVKIGIFSFAEREFNIAECGKWGTNYFDPCVDLECITELRKQTDYVIVLYHGGIEYYPFPSPELRKKCQAMVRYGADLVTCQHSHCVGSIENYNGRTIVYGQGNSIFGYRCGDENWNTGLLLQVEIFADKTFSFSWIGMEMTNYGLRKKVSPTLNKELEERSLRLCDQKYLDVEWLKFCKKLEKIELPLLLGWPKVMIGLNRRIGNILLKCFFTKHLANITHNMLRCDAHREVIDTLLKLKDYK